MNMKISEHKVISVDLASLGGSALTDGSISVPKDRSVEEIAHGIPATYVPARNLIFLSLATARAETIGSTDIFIGVNIVDFSGYPDCRPEFISAFENTANLGTRTGDKGDSIKIHSPLSGLSKAEIIRTGMRLGVDYSLTHSCYDPGPEGLACGTCDSCLLRKKGFSEAQLVDPTNYAT
jgi:7-cyano-7-deazaguanine synthase